MARRVSKSGRKPKSAPRNTTRSLKKRAPKKTFDLRIQWKELRPLYDFWGQEMKRFYKLETLANATEGLIRGNDRFITPSIHGVMGPERLVSLNFELFQEGRYQLIFKVKATNAKKKRGEFGFVVAKNAQEFSAIAKSEHNALQHLHERSPQHVVEVFRGGTVFLPDRHRHMGNHREVYAYLTRWLREYEELGVGKNLQFIVNAVPRHSFTRVQTELLKIQIIEVIARSFDPRRRTAMAIPQVASGDFVVTRPKGGMSKLKLIACRRLVENMSRAKLLHAIVRAKWDWGGQEFRLITASPEDFYDGIVKAVGKEEAHQWFTEYALGVKKGRLRRQPYLSKSTLSELGISQSS